MRSLKILRNYPTSKLTTMGVGGPAKFMLEASSLADLKEAVSYFQAQEIDYIVIGKGSNLIFHDEGFAGAVIVNKINFIRDLGDNLWQVAAGVSLSYLSSFTAKKNLSGLESAAGIPASVGGAVYMNAGANGWEMVDCLKSVEYLDPTGQVSTYNIDKAEFSYRHSPFQNSKNIIISATFKLIPSDLSRKKQLEIIAKRKQSQPLSQKSAGCIFRNPSQEMPAGKLIQSLGLSNFYIGGARVSPVHANFIVNQNGATAKELQELKTIIIKKVKEKTGIELESEVIFMPFELP